ncbi:MAG: hypothetical protein AB7T59_18245 [Hyphomonadaceae bacterium]
MPPASGIFALMRFTACLIALLLLSACATSPTTGPAESQREVATPNTSSLAAQLLAAAGRADAPNMAEIRRAIGAPDITRSEGAGAAWTYRLTNCALLLLFAADARGEMRLAEAHASARSPGEATPTIDHCAAEASVRRS